MCERVSMWKKMTATEVAIVVGVAKEGVVVVIV
jgi:hypothetical protein